MRPSQLRLTTRLMVAAALTGPGPLLAQETARVLPGPTSVTPNFDEEGLPYGDKGLTAQELRETWGPPAEIRCVAYSPDGKTLAVGDGPTRPMCCFPGPCPVNENGGLIRLVDTATNRVRMTLEPAKIGGHEYEVRRVAFSPDGKVLFTEGREDYRLEREFIEISNYTAWDATTGRVLHRISGENGATWIKTAVAPETGTLAAATERGVSLWDGATGRLRHLVLDLPSRPTALAFSPDGRALACGHEDGTLSVRDAATGQRFVRFAGRERHGRRYAIQVLAFSADGTNLASAGTFRRDEGELYRDYSELRVFSLVSRSERATMSGRDDEVFTCIAFSPDGKMLISGASWDTVPTPARGVLRLWDVNTGAERASFTTHRQGVLALRFSPDGRILTAADRGSIVLRDATSGAEKFVLFGDMRFPEFHELTFSPDGKTLASAHGSLQLWKLTSTPSPRASP